MSHKPKAPNDSHLIPEELTAVERFIMWTGGDNRDDVVSIIRINPSVATVWPHPGNGQKQFKEKLDDIQEYRDADKVKDEIATAVAATYRVEELPPTACHERHNNDPAILD